MIDTVDLVDSLRAISVLRREVEPFSSFPEQLAWLRKLKRITSQLQGLKKLRLALMGGGTLHHFAEVLRLWLYLEGFEPDLYICDYGSARQEMLSPSSRLYEFKPDMIWLMASERDAPVRALAPGAGQDVCSTFVTTVLEEYRTYWEQIRHYTDATIVQSNLAPPALRTFGHYEALVPWSRSSLISRINQGLAEQAHLHKISLFDTSYVAAQFGLRHWYQERQWHQSKQPFSPDAFGLTAFHFARLVGSMKGTARKCIVLDLDNTLWGGVIGDDGIAGIRLGDGAEGEAFSAFQKYLKLMADRGILLAVCSKNEEAIAKEPFEKHPSMHLHLEDIACFRANWKNKADNLRDIAHTLNIGLDSLVFVDDNPAERDLVGIELPEVSIVKLPTDPSEYAEAIAEQCFFEISSFSSEDLARSRFYQEKSRREVALSNSSDLASFLRELDMEANAGPPDAFHLPRMTQLLAKTNQFHPTTTRPSEAETAQFAANPDVWMRWFSLRDKFGDHGVISVVILVPEGPALAIHSWAMSCRVFSRGMEDFIFLDILKAARERNVRYLRGRYIPTLKNKPVADLYKKLGFTYDGLEENVEKWLLDVDSIIQLPETFIRWRQAEPSSLVAERA